MSSFSALRIDFTLKLSFFVFFFFLLGNVTK